MNLCNQNNSSPSDIASDLELQLPPSPSPEYLAFTAWGRSSSMFSELDGSRNSMDEYRDDSPLQYPRSLTPVCLCGSNHVYYGDRYDAHQDTILTGVDQSSPMVEDESMTELVEPELLEPVSTVSCATYSDHEMILEKEDIVENAHKSRKQSSKSSACLVFGRGGTSTF
ncbi:hypothetical protein AN958_05726 [Leucoagaricus sp. SymC.cos]|nr:hypothetical protein AN958_05726 [Leucoagaricus sp. SymC.cos]